APPGQPVTNGEPLPAGEAPRSVPPPLIAGRVANGPISNARVYLDINDDGQRDDDDLPVATTDSGGRFAARKPEFRQYRDNKGLLVDLTNATSPPHPFLAGNSPEPSGILRAPPGSEVVTKLTPMSCRRWWCRWM
ncbi:MAG: hypothetical protein ACPH8C_05840, partial [Candidatus Puniceispirillaceae bacterium]